jgi:hypothetical protein
MFDQPVKKRSNFTFAKVATILAVTAGVSFGLCTASFLFSGTRIAGFVFPVGTFFGGLVIACSAGLVLMLVVFLIKQVVDIFRKR